MSKTFNTLEEAQAEILRLNEELAARTTERDAARTENTTLTERNEQLHALNQNYFNKLSAQFLPQEDEGDEPEIPTCEEFAKSLTI